MASHPPAAPQESSATTTDTAKSGTAANGAGGSSGGGRFHCNYCERDISNEVRIKCAVCPDTDLCIDCFYVGVETGPHKNHHPYRVMDDMSAPIYTTKWGADEELLLLEGIELFGLGNWADIAEHVGNKTRFECEYHYWQVYVDVPTFPVPDTSRGILVDKEIMEKDVKKDDLGLVIQISETIGREPYYIQSKKKKQKKDKSSQIGADLQYLPLRGDFAGGEWQDSAEYRLALLELSDKDTERERKMKLQILECYEYKLEERIRRKEFAVERGLVNDFKKTLQNEKKMQRDEREQYFIYRPFSRFIRQEEFDELVQGLIREKQIRNRIETLKHYRQLGITNLADAERFEAEKKRREQDIEARRRRLVAERTTYRGRKDDLMTLPQTPMTAQPNTALAALSALPGAELLSAKEKELCAALKLQPKQYMVIKEGLIRESFRLGFLSQATTINILSGSLDAHSAVKIYDYFVLCGWIR